MSAAGDRGPSRTAGERLYRLALYAYPSAFRRRYGAEMVRHYRQRRAELSAGHRHPGARLLLEMVGDLAGSLPRQWSARQRSRRIPPHGTRPMTGILTDVRYAARSLRRRAGFTLTVVATLALGVGTNVAVLALVHGILLSPLPYPRPERLVELRQQSTTQQWNLSMADLVGVLESDDVFADVGGLAAATFTVRAEGEPREVQGGHVSGGFLGALGVEPAAGRSLRPQDSAPGAEPVVELGWSLAEELFGDAHDAPGRTVSLDGRPFTVAGVLPPGRDDLAATRGQAWAALTVETPSRRGPFTLRVIGRLADGVSVEVAADAMAAVSRRLFPQWADSFQDESARIVPISLHDRIVARARAPLLALLGAVALVLAVGLANVANLMLARAVGRRHEIAVRSVLGAGRGRLVRLLLAEAGLLSAAGGLLGLGLAAAAVRAFVASRPGLPRLETVSLDARSLAATLLLMLVCCTILGLAPLLAVRRPASSLGRGARMVATDARTETIRSVLVVAEFALALPLLAGAGLLVVTLLNLSRVDPGFDAAGLVAARVRLPAVAYPDPADVARYLDEVRQVVGATPGVDRVAFTTGLPPDSPRWFNNFDLVDRPVPAGQEQPVTPWTAVSPGFLESLRVPLLEGRRLDDADDLDGAPVALVSRAWADRFYPGESAVGRQMAAGGCPPDVCPPYTVVGVVGDVKYAGLDAGAETVYTPLHQEPSRDVWVVVRLAGPASGLLPAIGDRLTSVDATLPAPSWIALRDRLSASLAAPRAWAVLVSGFAVAAILLAATGVFGVLSWIVGRRGPEIGIRMALGADARSVQRLVVGAGLRRAGVGLGLGLLLAVAAGGRLESLLFGIGPGDPGVLAAVAGILLAIAALASWLPARRAARADAVMVMRQAE